MSRARRETAEQSYEWWEFEDPLSQDHSITYRLEKRMVKGGSEFTIQKDGKTITKGDVPKGCLQPKVLQLLEYFLIHGTDGFPRGHVEEALWHGSDNAAVLLGDYLNLLRALLEDQLPSSDKNKRKSGRLIITLRGEGLRFGGLNLRHEGPVSSSARLHGVPLLLQFIERPDILAAVKRHLLDAAGRAAIALQGMGGVGKTILAIRLCHVPEIRHAFSDGIIWFRIGRQSTIPFSEHFETIRKALGAPQSTAPTVESYRELLEDKAALIVLDDLWTSADLQPFLLSAGRSRLLYTSRDEGLANDANAEEVSVGALDPAQARALLETCSRRGPNLPEPHATGILRECSGLALALSMIGATLKNRPEEDWADILDLLGAAKLRNIEGHPPGYPYATLHAAIEVSVNALDDVHKPRYLRLALLADNAPVPTSLLRLLWNIDRSEARRSARLFASRSLARLEVVGLTLHDLQLKYLHGEHPDPDMLALVHAAFRRSNHAIRQRPGEAYAQLVGRLLPHRDMPAITALFATLELQAPKPGLLPIWAALDAAGDASRRVFEGPAAVCSIAISSDADRGISLHGDGTVICWDLTGKNPPRMRANAAIAGASDGLVSISSTVALTPNGRCAAWGQRESLAVWDVEGDQEPRVLPDDKGLIWAVALSVDGTFAVSSTGAYVTLWDVNANKQIRVFRGIDERPSTLVLHPNGRHLIGGYIGGAIMIWDALNEDPNGRFLVETQSPTEQSATDWVSTIAIDADHGFAASSTHPILVGYQLPELRSHERHIKLWYFDGPDPGPLPTESSAVGILAMAFEGDRLLVGGDAALVLYDFKRGAQYILGRPANWISAVSLTADQNHAISGDVAGQIVTWDLSRDVRNIPGHAGVVTTLAFAPDGKGLVSGGDDKRLIFWDLDGEITDQRDAPTPPWAPGHNPEQEYSDRTHREMLRIIEEVHADDDKRIRSADTPKRLPGPIYALAVSELAGRSTVRFLEGPASPINTVALAPDCSAVASSHGYRHDLRRRDPLGRMVPVGNTNGDSPLAVALSMRGDRVMAGYEDGALRFWDIDAQSRVLCRHEGRVWALALTPDGVWALSGGDTPEVRVWDLREEPVSRVLTRPRNPVTAVALTGDGRYAATALAEGEVLLWDLGAGVVLRQLRLHKGPVFCLSFSPDGRRLLSGGADHILGAWDLFGDRPPATLTADAEIRCCVATLTHAAAGDKRGRVHLFAFDD